MTLERDRNLSPKELAAELHDGGLTVSEDYVRAAQPAKCQLHLAKEWPTRFLGQQIPHSFARSANILRILADG